MPKSWYQLDQNMPPEGLISIGGLVFIRQARSLNGADSSRQNRCFPDDRHASCLDQEIVPHWFTDFSSVCEYEILAQWAFFA